MNSAGLRHFLGVYPLRRIRTRVYGQISTPWTEKPNPTGERESVSTIPSFVLKRLSCLSWTSPNANGTYCLALYSNPFKGLVRAARLAECTNANPVQVRSWIEYGIP